MLPALSFASVLPVVLAVLYMLTALVFALDPVTKTRNAHEYVAALARNSKYRMALHKLRVVTGVFGLGCVPLAYHRLSVNPWLDWASLIAIAGYGSMIIGHARALFALPLIVKEHAEVSDAVKPSIARQLSVVLLDSRGWIEVAGISVWALIVTLCAKNEGTLSSVPIALAFLYAGTSLVNVFGWTTHKYRIVSVSMAAGFFLFGPAWFVWLSSFVGG